jgi:putative ABC transport system permease protein
MLKISLRSLWAHKRRLIGTVLSIFLGVAFLSGTFVLNDTLDKSFEALFTDAVGDTDVEVRAEAVLDVGDDLQAAAPIDMSLAEQIAEVDGVAAVAPYVQGFGQLLGADGEPLGGAGPPTFAGSWIDEPRLSPYELDEGRAPDAPGEVVINRAAADDGDLAVGDTTTLNTPDATEVEIVGISTFAGGDGLGGVTFAGLTLPQAQELLTGSTDQVSTIRVAGEAGVSQDELAQRIGQALPDGVETITGDDLVAESTDEISRDFLAFFQAFLVVFAAIALLVAAFSINNTLSILVAQRTRDSALLRALGARRSQVLAAVVAEAVVIGVVASALGVLGGIGLAVLLKGLFAGFGFALPAEGLVVSAATIITGLLVGTVVTTVAGVLPALKASRVSPLAALRDVAVDRSASRPARIAIGAGLTLLGVGLVVSAVLGDSDGVMALAGLGSLATLVGIVVIGPVVARPAASILGWPVARTRGVVGSMARRNAMRNPRRTAATASALMIGVGVVTLFTVFAASLKASVDETVDQSFGGDLVITSTSFDAGQLSPGLADAVDAAPEVERAVGIGAGGALIDGSSRVVTVADPAALDDLVDLDVSAGSLETAGDTAFAVTDDIAEDHGWEVGDTVPVTWADGATQDLTLAATYGTADLAGEWLVPRAAWEAHATQSVDFTVLIDLAEDVPLSEGRAAVEHVASSFGSPEVLDRDEYAESVAGFVNQALTLVYVMLALAILIALMGIANTLSLSVYERTRELGLLRAVGQTRRQTSAMVRWESVLIATFGTIGGLGLGVFLGWALFTVASARQGFGAFAVPGGQLLVVLIVGALAGVLAGIRPARRAARLDVLAAVSSE